MAEEAGMFKFLSPRVHPQSTDIQAVVGWGAAAATTAIWLIQGHLTGSRRLFWRKGNLKGREKGVAFFVRLAENLGHIPQEKLQTGFV